MNYEIKAVTKNTTFEPVRVFDQGIERYAMIDQDSQLVGLVEREEPYFILGTFSDACVASKRGLRSGANYKGYACSRFGSMHYVLDTLMEPVAELSEVNEIKEVQLLANRAIELLNQIRNDKSAGTKAPPMNEKEIN